MKRGMLTINQLPLSQVISNLPATESNQFLINKLKSGINSQQQIVQILISEDELDLIMDNLPIPNQNEEPALTEARQTIQSFLSQLRFS